MNIFLDIPLLTADKVYRLLADRFADGHKRLKDIPSPTLLKNSKKAAQRIADAVKNGEKITLVGDYDVDGVTSTSIMVLFFREIGYPLNAIIPNRFADGYGINENILQRINADLVITVDNGITAVDAARICKERGIDLIITDHHTPSRQLPDAFAIVNPKLDGCTYPFKEICGAQVAWLLLGLVKKELGVQIDMKQYLDLVALAVIADVMPLQNINRAIVQEGLKQMASSPRPSSIIIKEFLNKAVISSEDIAFSIAPRINSAGRLEDASIALEFLTAETYESAAQRFETLNNLNNIRKSTEAQTAQTASLFVDQNDKVIVVAGKDWHEGVVGIVASRLVNKFKKPSIVLNVHNGIAKGSARSIGDVDIFSLIDSQKNLLEKFGGHKMAAGLSLREDKIEAFKRAINEEASKIDPNDFLPKENILGELESDAINFELLDILEKFEPYGEGNPRPKFLIRDARLQSIKLFGADRSHSRLNIKIHPYDKKILEIVAFRQVLEVPGDKKITCSYTVGKNVFNGRTSIQLMLDTLYN
ncbi:single-stranded-DNA-specific exonuclease RecJ [Sulfurimonas sp. HSL-1716]|uniref:single-stranded-DNA-specific exonuclease RecJ n=1 Tax=Hydrocurvibacter sulfurireducens TaxID=3131937 RepID=UPI0031F935D9